MIRLTVEKTNLLSVYNEDGRRRFVENMIADVTVNGNLTKICHHFPGRDELHFLINQRPFFLYYIKFGLYGSLSSTHAITPFHSEDLGRFSTIIFNQQATGTGRQKYEKATLFLCLLKNFIPLSLLQKKP